MEVICILAGSRRNELIAEKSKESSLSPATELQNDVKSSKIKIGEVSPVQEDDVSDILETPPQQQQRKAKSTMIKMALLAPLCLINLIVFGAFSVLSPFFSKEAQRRGATGSVVGFIFGSYPLVIVLSSPIFGRLVAKCGPRRVLVAGIIVGSSSLSLFGLGGLTSDAVTFVLVSLSLRIVSAIAAAALLTAKFAIAMEEYSGEELSTVAGIMESFTGAGTAIGPAIGGFLRPIGGYKLPFIAMGCLMLCTLPLFLLTFHLIGTKNQEKKKLSEEESVSTWQLLKIPEVFIVEKKKLSEEESVSTWQLLKIPEVFIVAMCYSTAGTTYSFFDPVLGPHLQSAVGMSVTDVGVVFSFYATVYCVLTPFFGWILKKTVSKHHNYLLSLVHKLQEVGHICDRSGKKISLPFYPKKKASFLEVYVEISFETHCYRFMITCGLIATGISYLLLGPVPFMASIVPANETWFVYLIMGANGVFQGVFWVTMLPILKRTSTLRGIPDNLATNGILSALVVTMTNIGVTIGPTLAGIMDEKLGFSWAATIEGLICIFQAFLYFLVILFEKVSRRYEASPEADEEDEEKKALLELDSD
ncbi:unnamed protein product [Porites evermanni]|uniref:Major facilitator superfamily (MFS) profile domain-containing protein n=1 Tax=Porites evermanni TaxID=104178 RepID=A0ABN8M550_9CNID|nr:unnamed protein product [Porites evermanni]